ncbi:MAG: FliM/FliN family flagellar motor switch protein [Deltaproteobacteria bacterium]|nr:FliM/FliN family flagellar motor switch protein [Deltaproteobacteria bacterium]
MAEATADKQEAPVAAPVRDWGSLKDIPLPLTIEIGRTRLKVRDILGLEPGSLVTTTKLSGEAMDLSLDGDIFARVEIVIIKDKLWARLTKIVGGER